MNGTDKKYLIDSNILIYHFNGVDTATDFLRNNLSNCYISRLTFIEVLSFDFGEAEQDVIFFLKQFHILDTSDEIALQSLKNRKLKKIKLPDNLILSTAQVHNLVLVTRNVKDFDFSEVEILDIFLA